ncbi:AAA family ATPase [Hymenobacter sp. ISL-91]|uniref:AAA family ATPase n=1 Tax=Hymenobacter sp. ISL-91 TaxID=2819151 RepID=UPI001BECCA88|nr:AAA family ATPase [Hymenobacter sp. ISL-91]MBT2556254.1 AAA family ATPase [Hymenobacter sp. ISL-91]
MENAINTLRIQNFKSIKDVTMNPRRVNLIIGMPNVGKSNILEAMSLLGGRFPQSNFASRPDESGRHYGGIVRYHEVRQLFHDNMTNNPIVIQTDNDICVMGRDYSTGNGFRYVLAELDTWNRMRSEYTNKYSAMPEDKPENRMLNFFIEWKDSNVKPFPQYIHSQILPVGQKSDGVSSQGNGPYAGNRYVRPYIFKQPKSVMNENYMPYLLPPYGDNLVQIVEAYPSLRKEVSQLFSKYGLKLLIRIDERRMEVIKDLDGVIYSYPYSSIADTLQRMIFYMSVIESNNEAVILLEEPEAHSFPVYVSDLGRRIAESRDNQFFIATYSPYLVTEIMEQMLPEEGQEGELVIFLAYYEEYQTKVKQLSDEEIREIRNDSIDVFYNLSRFTPGSNSYA